MNSEDLNCFERKGKKKEIDEFDLDKKIEQRFNLYDKNIMLQFTNTNEKIQQVLNMVTAINGRVSTTEKQVRTLEDHRLNRANDCPFKNEIMNLTRKQYHDNRLEEYITTVESKRTKVEEKRDRGLKFLLALITAILTLFTFLMNYKF